MANKVPGGIIELDESQFNLFRDIIYREAGIKLSDMKKALVQSRLLRRLRELQLFSYEEYHEFLQENYNEEIINLINCITTNKTEFFREARHFDFMHQVVLPEYERMKKRTLRIWCAGCSTGEEPYTIAITLLEYYRDKQVPDIKILATDIDTRVLEIAQEGRYKKEILEMLNVDMLRRYFMRGKEVNIGFYRVKDHVKKYIFFRRLNLLNDTYPMKNQFDIIFCRNVIIYFDKDTQQRLFAQFHRYLKDDGYLFLGHSESLTDENNRFVFQGNSIYRKKV